jgi:cytochrome bd-type quinol oxidase subunit 1
MFHMLWPVLTIGLALFLVVVEALWLKTGDADYYHHARFWSKLLMLNFALGMVSGLPLEFEFIGHAGNRRLWMLAFGIGSLRDRCYSPVLWLYRTALVHHAMGFFIAMLPLAGLAAWVRLLQALNRGKEYAPFVWSVVIFTVSFVGLAASLYPYLVPPTMSLAESASSSATLVFMLAGIGLLIPVLLVYNGFQYLVFRGKIAREIPASSAKAADVARDAEHSANTTAGSVRQHAD